MTLAAGVEGRARLSLGTDAGPDISGATVGVRVPRYVGADVVRYDDFPADGDFHGIDALTGRNPT